MTAKTPVHPTAPVSSPVSRRTLFAGAGTVGALAAAAALLPGSKAVQSAAAAGPAVEGEGYRLTEHVKRYYQTARV
jgi:hypothetical protein